MVWDFISHVPWPDGNQGLVLLTVPLKCRDCRSLPPCSVDKVGSELDAQVAPADIRLSVQLGMAWTVVGRYSPELHLPLQDFRWFGFSMFPIVMLTGARATCSLTLLDAPVVGKISVAPSADICRALCPQPPADSIVKPMGKSGLQEKAAERPWEDRDNLASSARSRVERGLDTWDSSQGLCSLPRFMPTQQTTI